MTKLLRDLPIGSKVKDITWEWEHRTGDNYTGSGKTKPVTWLIVAKNHTGYPDNSVTLLTDELIARHWFDNSTDRRSDHGSPHWGNSGTTNADKGIRKFLNGSSYTGNDTNSYDKTFYDAFSKDFKEAILETTVPNSEDYDKHYTTQDNVFVPSKPELGGGDTNIYPAGEDYGYFSSVSSRIAKLDGKSCGYWTRSMETTQWSQGKPFNQCEKVSSDGYFTSVSASRASIGVRPVLNLKADVLVSDTTDADGAYTIIYNMPPLITLNTTDNRTLYENDTIAISGTAKDTAGDVVTVKYNINNGTSRAILAVISDGTSVPFNKTLTFKQGKLFDGSKAITSELPEGTEHILKVWVEDDQGGKSEEQIRRFFVVPNRPTTLTLNPFSSKTDLIDTDKITISGHVTDPDGNDIIVSYKIGNGSYRKIYEGKDGGFEFQIQLSDLKVGNNKITVQAEDSYGAKTLKTLEVTKAENLKHLTTSVARYKIMPPDGTAKGVVLWIERETGDLTVDVEISMTMNGEEENFVPMKKTSTAFVRDGIEEDEWTYEADTPKENIILKITMNRASPTSDKGITLISGVLS